MVNPRRVHWYRALGLFLCVLSAMFVIFGAWWIAVVLFGAPTPGTAPEPQELPILECADGGWMTSREPGICYYRGGDG